MNSGNKFPPPLTCSFLFSFANDPEVEMLSPSPRMHPCCLNVYVCSMPGVDPHAPHGPEIHGGVQKSMGNKVPWKTGMLIYLSVTSRPLISLQKEAVSSPCNLAIAHLTAFGEIRRARQNTNPP